MSLSEAPDHPTLKTWHHLCQSVFPVWQQHLNLAQQHSDQGVRALLASFADLNLRIRQQPELASPDILAALDQILTAFQYHDRLDQMMQLLQNDLGRLSQAAQLQPDTPALDSAQWLQRLESEYVMAEQHALHTNPVAPGASDDTTTYF